MRNTAKPHAAGWQLKLCCVNKANGMNNPSIPILFQRAGIDLNRKENGLTHQPASYFFSLSGHDQIILFSAAAIYQSTVLPDGFFTLSCLAIDLA